MKKKLEKRDKFVEDFYNSVKTSDSPLFFDLLDRHCLFFDKELICCFDLVERLFRIFKNVRKRFERQKTLQISSSVARYMDFVNESNRYPHLLYNFTCWNKYVCVFKNHKWYSVFCSGFTPSDYYDSYRDSRDDRVFGKFEKIADCLDLFSSLVLDSVKEYIRELPF